MVSVIIVNWNGRPFLENCLKGLRNQVYQPVVVTLVDNGSTDESIDFIGSSFPEIKLICLKENVGFAAANNIAIESVGTEYIALLNNDAVPHPLWLANLLDGLRKHPDAGFAASKMLFYHRPEQIDRAGDVFTTAGTAFFRGRGRTSEAYNEIEYVFGACAGAALYRTEMLREIGLFDEDFFVVHEDVDLSFRAQLSGYKCIYVPEAVVYHVGGRSVGNDSAISVYYGHRNLEWVYIKNMPKRLIVKTIVPHIIYDIGALLYFAAIGRLKEFVRAKVDVVRGMPLVLQKRRSIQSRKKVDDLYVWNLLEEERFFPRLTRRLVRT